MGIFRKIRDKRLVRKVLKDKKTAAWLFDIIANVIKKAIPGQVDDVVLVHLRARLVESKPIDLDALLTDLIALRDQKRK
tara:strand:- start:5131 stop:5367 length:237 start_codon:yes stop_codon:yes gene_type:complete